MNQMNTFLKEKFHMKSFDHVKLNTELPDISTQNIEGKRFYVTPEGNKYPSITTVLSGRSKEGILKWRQSVGNDVANQIMRSAAKRGTAVHQLVEDYLNNEELGNQEVLPLAMFTLLKPELDNINNIVAQEVGLYSDRWGIAGRVDCIAEYDGKLTVIDFNTYNCMKIDNSLHIHITKYTRNHNPNYNQEQNYKYWHIQKYITPFQNLQPTYNYYR